MKYKNVNFKFIKNKNDENIYFVFIKHNNIKYILCYFYKINYKFIKINYGGVLCRQNDSIYDKI